MQRMSCFVYRKETYIFKFYLKLIEYLTVEALSMSPSYSSTISSSCSFWLYGKLSGKEGLDPICIVKLPEGAQAWFTIWGERSLSVHSLIVTVNCDFTAAKSNGNCIPSFISRLRFFRVAGLNDKKNSRYVFISSISSANGRWRCLEFGKTRGRLGRRGVFKESSSSGTMRSNRRKNLNTHKWRTYKLILPQYFEDKSDSLVPFRSFSEISFCMPNFWSSEIASIGDMKSWFF